MSWRRVTDCGGARPLPRRPQRRPWPRRRPVSLSLGVVVVGRRHRRRRCQNCRCHSRCCRRRRHPNPSPNLSQTAKRTLTRTTKRRRRPKAPATRGPRCRPRACGRRQHVPCGEHDHVVAGRPGQGEHRAHVADRVALKVHAVGPNVDVLAARVVDECPWTRTPRRARWRCRHHGSIIRRRGCRWIPNAGIGAGWVAVGGSALCRCSCRLHCAVPEYFPFFFNKPDLFVSFDSLLAVLFFYSPRSCAYTPLGWLVLCGAWRALPLSCVVSRAFPLWARASFFFALDGVSFAVRPPTKAKTHAHECRCHFFFRKKNKKIKKSAHRPKIGGDKGPTRQCLFL